MASPRSAGGPDRPGSPRRPGSPSALRRANGQRVTDHLGAAGTATQAEVARATGLAPATVSNIVRELLSSGRIEAAGDGRGRRLSLPRGAGFAVGIDYGHRHITVAVSDLGHEILAEERVDLGPSVPADEGMSRARLLVDRALARVGGSLDSVVGVGMGLPAPIDRLTGQVGAPSVLPGWVGVDAAACASDALGRAVLVDNDANLGVVAEHLWGAGRGVDDLAFIKMSEGVGAGLVLGGQLFRGRDGMAGEIGHTTMDEFGAFCRCGNRGCLETIVAARAVVELLEPSLGKGLTIADIVRMAHEGVVACDRVLADVGRQAGVAVANLVNVFNPELILIGGELALAGELMLAPMREVVRRCGIPGATSNVTIARAELGARAPVLGALALVLAEDRRDRQLRLAT